MPYGRHVTGADPSDPADRSAAAAVLVRRAAPGDRDVVWPLVRSFATSFVPDRGAVDAADDDLLADPDALVLVAEVDARVVGYLVAHVHATLFANAPVAWIEELMVDEPSRRTGVGARLVAEAEAWARNRGAAYSALATRRAAPFYERLGYDESATLFRRLL